MKNLKYFTLALMAIFFASCGSSSEDEESIVLTPATTNIKGYLGQFYDVVYKDYTINDDILTIEIERNDNELPFNIKGVKPYGYYGQGITAHAGFGIEILNETGDVIEKKAATASMYYSDDIKEALNLRAGETGTIRWFIYFHGDVKPAEFRLTSAYEEVEEEEDDDSNSSSVSGSDNSSSSVSSNNSSSSGYGYGYSSSSSYGSSSDDDDSDRNSSDDEDWDSLIDSYEEYVDKYISYMEKAMKGDMSALAEYPSLLEKVEEYSTKMDKAKGNMSSAQMSRYMKITNKMTEAAMKMK